MKPESRKSEIIKKAAFLFKEKGYSAVTMRDLAKDLGIKAASLYNHIDSKQDLLSTIIISLAEEFTLGMSLIINSEKSSIEKLRQIVRLHVDIASRNIHGMASLNNDWMHLEEQLDHYLNMRKDYEANFRQIILSGIACNEIKEGPSEVTLFSMLSTLRSLYLWIPIESGINKDKLAEDLSEVLINGIAVKH